MRLATWTVNSIRTRADRVASWLERTDFGPAGEQAREELARFLADLDAQAARFVESRERARARMAARGELPVQV